jgi:hypothetical protein
MDNSDGMGVAIAMGKELKVYKEMKDFPYFRDLIEQYEKYDMIVHFRIATHGYVDLDNCHPFMISDKVAMIHNGVLSGMDDADFVRSDTRVFAEDYLTPIMKDFPGILENTAFLSMITQIAGSWNRIAFLTADGRYAIINEDDGEWINECWFSNTHWKWTSWKNTYKYDSTEEKHVLVGSDYVDDKDDESIREAYKRGGAGAAMDVAFEAIEAEDLDEVLKDPRCAICEMPIYAGDPFCIIDSEDKDSQEKVCEDCTLGTSKEANVLYVDEKPDYSG